MKIYDEVIKDLREIEYNKSRNLEAYIYVDRDNIVRHAKLWVDAFNTWLHVEPTNEMHDLARDKIFETLQNYVDEHYGSNARSIYNKVGAL